MLYNQFSLTCFVFRNLNVFFYRERERERERERVSQSEGRRQGGVQGTGRKGWERGKGAMEHRGKKKGGG